MSAALIALAAAVVRVSNDVRAVAARLAEMGDENEDEEILSQADALNSAADSLESLTAEHTASETPPLTGGTEQPVAESLGEGQVDESQLAAQATDQSASDVAYQATDLATSASSQATPGDQGGVGQGPDSPPPSALPPETGVPSDQVETPVDQGAAGQAREPDSLTADSGSTHQDGFGESDQQPAPAAETQPE